MSLALHGACRAAHGRTTHVEASFRMCISNRSSLRVLLTVATVKTTHHLDTSVALRDKNVVRFCLPFLWTTSHRIYRDSGCPSIGSVCYRKSGHYRRRCRHSDASLYSYAVGVTAGIVVTNGCAAECQSDGKTRPSRDRA